VVLGTGLSVFPLSAILLLDFGTVPKVWFSLFFVINNIVIKDINFCGLFLLITKNKENHTFGTVPKSNNKIAERGKTDSPVQPTKINVLDYNILSMLYCTGSNDIGRYSSLKLQVGDYR
jgi:hypothetical protein